MIGLLILAAGPCCFVLTLFIVIRGQDPITCGFIIRRSFHQPNIKVDDVQAWHRLLP